jgi:dipeptidyl aminopeptidase/acylaminoacyl peptidase
VLNVATGGDEALTARAGFYTSPFFNGKGSFIYRENVEDHYLLRRYDLARRRSTELGPSRGVVYTPKPYADERLVFLFSDADTPLALAAVEVGSGEVERLGQFGLVRETDVVAPVIDTLKVDGRSIRTYSYFPRTEEPRAPQGPRPAIIWLHGAGGSFSPRWHTYAQYFANADFVFGVVNFSGSAGMELAPSLRSFEARRRAQVNEVIRYRKALLESSSPSVDPDRIFLVSVSSGTGALEELATRHSDLFRAVVEYAPLAGKAFAEPSTGLPPILAWVGVNDAPGGVAQKLLELQRLDEMGNRVRAVTVRGEGHDLRDKAAIGRRAGETLEFLREML